MVRSDVEAFINDNGERLDEFAEKYGISGTSRAMIRFEAFSRTMGIKALKNINPYAPLSVTDGLCRWDLNYSGYNVEVKVRYAKYPDDRISKSKIRCLKDKNAIICVISIDDGTVRCYRASDWTSTGTWAHKNKTAEEGEWIKDEYVCYQPVSACWTTTVTIPYGKQGNS